MAAKRKASTKSDLESKIAALEKKLSKLADQLEAKPAPKPAEVKPAEIKPAEVKLADVDKKVSKMFGVWGKKKFMGREYMGVMRSTFLVDGKGKIFKIYPKVKAAGHSKDVLEDFLNSN